MSGVVAQLVESLLNMHEALGLISSPASTSCGNLGSAVQGLPWLHKNFQASLRYPGPCLKKKSACIARAFSLFSRQYSVMITA